MAKATVISVRILEEFREWEIVQISADGVAATHTISVILVLLYVQIIQPSTSIQSIVAGLRSSLSIVILDGFPSLSISGSRLGRVSRDNFLQTLAQRG